MRHACSHQAGSRQTPVLDDSLALTCQPSHTSCRARADVQHTLAVYIISDIGFPMLTRLISVRCNQPSVIFFLSLFLLYLLFFFFFFFSTISFKGEVYPKIKFSPVVVFWVLSRMVLVRGSCDAPFLLESQSNSRTSTETG